MIKITRPTTELTLLLNGKNWIAGGDESSIILLSSIKMDMKDSYFITFHNDKRTSVFATIDDMDDLEMIK